MRANNVKRQLDGSINNDDPFFINKNCELQKTKSCDFLNKFANGIIYNGHFKKMTKFNRYEIADNGDEMANNKMNDDINDLNSIKEAQNCALEKEPQNERVIYQKALNMRNKKIFLRQNHKNNNICDKNLKKKNGYKCTTFLGFNRGNYKRYKKNRIKYHNNYDFYNYLSFLSLLFLFVVFSVFLWKFKILITNLTTLMKEDASSKVDNHIGLEFQSLYNSIKRSVNNVFLSQSNFQNITTSVYNKTTKFVGSLKNKSLTIASHVLHNIPIKLKANLDIAILNWLNVTNNVTLG
jgi:hypothetical protein